MPDPNGPYDKLKQMMHTVKGETPFKTSFMPSTKVEEFVSNDEIMKEALGEDGALISYVRTEAKKLFLILCKTQQLNSIRCFYKSGFTDDSLPVHKLSESSYDIYTLGRRAPNWKSFKALTHKGCDEFISEQWMFLAPSFQKDKFTYTFREKEPLPFMLRDYKSKGGFGLVRKVSIPEGHHDYETTSTHSGSGGFEVALKCLKTETNDATEIKKFYDRERVTLEKMRGLERPHLIKALAAYEKEGEREWEREWGFVFPWANGGNLLEFWMKPGINYEDKNLRSWALEQICGLVEGIKTLHDVNTRHGDIKPTNILIFESEENNRRNLVIADVGLAKFHALDTSKRLNPTTTKHHTRRYEPPEVAKERPEVGTTGYKLSRKYDMWSLGCTLFEFLIWLTYGRKGFEDFFAKSQNERSDDCYHNNGSLSEVIETWMKLLHDLPSRSPWHAIMVLIQTNLLIIDVNKRAGSDSVLKEITAISESDSSIPSDHTLTELRNRQQLHTSPVNSMNLSLSENRPSKLRDAWEDVTDNNLAHRILGGLSISRKSASANLCSLCESLDLKSPIINLHRTIDDVVESAGKCGFCKLLSHCLSQSKVICTKPLRLFREGSVLYASATGPPLVTIYSNPDGNSTTSPHVRIGLADLFEATSPQRFQLLREWIRLCDETHECTSIQKETRTSAKMPTRVIDVGLIDNPRLRLIEPSKSWMEKYIALSHCWGKTPEHLSLVTKKSNVARLKDGFNVNELPKTFQDAVRTARALGIRYLWIDSLCIIQDDKKDWETEAKKMGDVYSFAYLTIAASSATSSLDGFLERSKHRRCATVATTDGPLHLAEAIDNFVEDVEDGILNTRGWVLQERALSRRIIHFTSTQMYWECGNGVHCETLTQLRNPRSQFLGDPDFPRQGLSYFKDERIRLVQYLYTMYCGLNLTKASDRSVAINGILKRLSDAFQLRVDYGIFWKFHERSVLWLARVWGSLSRIDYANNDPVPSWSWMAYSGEIQYPDIPFGKVDWTEDLSNPFVGELQNGVCTGILAARARKLTIKRKDMDGRVALDMDVLPGFDGGDWRCITVGKKKAGSEDENLSHYVLLIRPLPGSQSQDIYERIGIGILTPTHFSTEVDEVKLV
ncbi:hypothetical protein GGR55DRAFT_703415 [Xylaria sp. FL0064]|nr:hypothetical protein GGR55DRAFT_703415 [Xylaria sp. FL0064]